MIKQTSISYIKLIAAGLLMAGTISFLFFFLVSCQKDDPKPKPAPSITSFTPASGIVGATVTITGTNFSITASENEVEFNGTAAIVTASTATEIITTVPVGTTSGKITVLVNGKAATSANDFVVTLPGPTITSFSPLSGLVGTTVTITGTNFSTVLASNTVKFNNTTATVTAATVTQLTTTVPIGATTGKITVEVNAQIATSVPDFVVPPTITSFSPTSGVHGASVVITGTNFSTTPANNSVKFNMTSATVTAATATQLTTSVPAGATTGKITVEVNAQIATSVSDFVVIQPPTITSFSPTYSLPGATVTITGTNFSATPANNTVTFNGAAAIVNNASATQLTVSVPAAATSGSIRVQVGGLAGSLSGFEVLKDFPRNGLVAYYPFNGNANDGSGNNLNGTVTEAVLATDRFGKSNQAYSFDGVNDKISMGNPPLLQINTQITVAAWINSDVLNVVPGGNGVTFISKIGSGPKGYWLYQNAYGDGTPSLSMVLYGAAFTSKYVGPAPIAASSWIFVTLVINNTSVKFYSNGTLLAADDVTASANALDDGSQGDLNIGTYNGGFFFDGKVDDIMIYNRPLSAAEVTQLYQQTVSKY